MDKKAMKKLAEELASGIKTAEDYSNFSATLHKMTLEAALGAEMEHHLGYTKNARSDNSNSRNGYTQKKLKTNDVELKISTPRDRDSDFEPQIIKKRQSRITDFDHRILALYSRGMTTRDIVAFFKETYDADVSATLVSHVTNAVIEQVKLWQSQPLERVYPVVYLDCIVVKIRQDGRVINKAIYLALGIKVDGNKELLGMWISENEGAKFWANVLDELKTRGLEDILIACVDGLSGFPEAIGAAYPKTKVQLCIVHMVRNSVKYVSYKQRKEVCADLKKIYQAMNEKQALQALDEFAKKWDDKLPAISRMWRRNWDNLITIFDFPTDIRKIIYTTNAIESLNSVIRKSTKNRKIFPNDDSALKVVYLACEQASKKWTMPIRNWMPALNRFVIEFGDRLELVE
ncbi:MAG: IS256 family transposase [Mesoflavibacter sp.]|nr:IS256 family transposase [Mesoflavibacter sp.]